MLANPAGKPLAPLVRKQTDLVLKATDGAPENRTISLRIDDENAASVEPQGVLRDADHALDEKVFGRDRIQRTSNLDQRFFTLRAFVAFQHQVDQAGEARHGFVVRLRVRVRQIGGYIEHRADAVESIFYRHRDLALGR